MRCKNCGFDNQEGRYICENCGSPLFDDNDQIVPEEDDPDNQPAHKLDEPDESDAYEEDSAEDEKAKNKKSIIIIIVLAVILVAMIVGIIVAAVVNNDDETTTNPSVTVTSDLSETETEKTTRNRTTERTTESTTESTTKRTTTTTTVARYTISVDIDGNGSVSGDGTFESGKKITLTATPDTGYQFTGWYDNDTGAQVASATRYTIRVDSNRNLTARFAPLPEQNEPTGGTEPNEQG